MGKWQGPLPVGRRGSLCKSPANGSQSRNLHLESQQSSRPSICTSRTSTSETSTSRDFYRPGYYRPDLYQPEPIPCQPAVVPCQPAVVPCQPTNSCCQPANPQAAGPPAPVGPTRPANIPTVLEIWVTFDGARWYSAGPALVYSPDRFVEVGDYQGLPVYRTDSEPPMKSMFRPCQVGSSRRTRKDNCRL